jgi:hypothetical protein
MLAALETTLDLAFRIFDAIFDEVFSFLARRFEPLAETFGILGRANEQLSGFEGFDCNSGINGSESNHVDVITAEDPSEICNKREVYIRDVFECFVIYDADVNVTPRRSMAGRIGSEQQCKRYWPLFESLDHGLANIRLQFSDRLSHLLP